MRRFARSFLGCSKHTGRLTAAGHADRRCLLFLQRAIIACVALLPPPPRAPDEEGSGFTSTATSAAFTLHRRLSQWPRSFVPGLAEGRVKKNQKTNSKLLRFVSRHFWASFARLLSQTLVLVFSCFFDKGSGCPAPRRRSSSTTVSLKIDGQMNELVDGDIDTLLMPNWGTTRLLH